jgi:uncharacterized protein (DUF58 family)
MSRGLGLLAGAALLVLAAGALASLALFALAIGLLVVVVVAGASVLLAAHRLRVTRSVLQRETQEDQPIGVRFQVRGLGRLPLPVHLQTQVTADRWVPLGEGGDTLDLMVGRRGAWRLGPSRLRLRDCLGLFERSLLVGQPEPLLILPTPDLAVPIPVRRRAEAGDLDPDGLQPYVPGTPVGRIHWPALARGAGLQQRRLAPPPPSGLPLVLVDTTGTSDPRALDRAARTAAGVIVWLASSGGCRVLPPGDQAATTITGTGATWRRVHRRLALMAPPDPAARHGETRVGRAADVHIRAAHALAEQPRPLPPGVVAVTGGRVGL